jgi:hypothetical protein
MGCGYHSYCGKGTSFISRAFGTNDYCVDGTRVSVSDSGESHACGRQITDHERESILIYELERYAEYLDLRHKFSFPTEPLPFTLVIT